jgi:hypothetical protein
MHHVPGIDGRAPGLSRRARRRRIALALSGLLAEAIAGRAAADLAPDPAPAGAAPAEAAPAPGGTRSATFLFAGTELSVLPTVPGRAAMDAAVRRHFAIGLALEARLGGLAGFSTDGGGALLGLRVGASAGWSFAIGRRVMITPMLAYDRFWIWGETAGDALVVQRTTLELPVTILLYPHVVLEPVVHVGVASIGGQSDLALVIVPRVGVVF